MTAFDLLPALAGFAFVSSITPGPNNLMLMASGANFGVRRSLPHMLGVGIGFTAMIVAVGLGLNGLFETLPWTHTALEVFAVVYLLWLAWKIGTAEPGPPEQEARGPSQSGGARPLSFAQAALFQWVNPKAGVIALGGLAADTPAAGSGPVAPAVVLALVFLLVTLPTVAFWTLVGVGAARVLRTRHALRAFNLAMAALLVLSLVPMVLGG